MDTRAHTFTGPLKILFLTDSPISVSGGSERFLRNLVTGLPREHFLPSVVQLCDEPSAAAQVYAANIPSSVDLRYLRCHAVYDRSGLHAYRVLRRRVLHEGFHFIQSQHENADFINALLPRGPLAAVRISNRRDTGFLKSPRLRLASRLLNRRYDRIVAPTTAVLDAVSRSEHAPREHMLCIPNGVDAERFHPAPLAQRDATRVRLGLAADSTLIGCVADLFPVKRHVDLIDAFRQVHTALPNAHLLLIGNGPQHAVIEASILELGLADAVHLLGPRRDVDALLPAMDLFTLASDTEGLSNAILEAQACGLPVVATAVGGNPDLVNAENGMLVPPRDPQALANAMLDLLGNPARRDRMGATARKHIECKHSLDAMIRAYMALYREYAGAH